MTPFGGPKYDEHKERCKRDEWPCAFCGKPIKTANPWHFAVRVLDGGARFGNEAEFHEPAEIDAGDMLTFPVGSTCARKLRAAGVFVGEVRS